MENCIEWKHATSRAGYGVKRIGGKNFYAHRLAYCIDRGVSMDDIRGKEVRHDCNNPKCVNPRHLRLGTHADNMSDMARSGHSHKGERSPIAKLTEADVRAIRAAYARGDRYPRRLAKQYGINYYTVMKVANRKLWGWLE